MPLFTNSSLAFYSFGKEERRENGKMKKWKKQKRKENIEKTVGQTN